MKTHSKHYTKTDSGISSRILNNKNNIQKIHSYNNTVNNYYNITTKQSIIKSTDKERKGNYSSNKISFFSKLENLDSFHLNNNISKSPLNNKLIINKRIKLSNLQILNNSNNNNNNNDMELTQQASNNSNFNILTTHNNLINDKDIDKINLSPLRSKDNKENNNSNINKKKLTLKLTDNRIKITNEINKDIIGNSNNNEDLFIKENLRNRNIDNDERFKMMKMLSKSKSRESMLSSSRQITHRNQKSKTSLFKINELNKKKSLNEKMILQLRNRIKSSSSIIINNKVNKIHSSINLDMNKYFNKNVENQYDRDSGKHNSKLNRNDTDWDLNMNNELIKLDDEGDDYKTNNTKNNSIYNNLEIRRTISAHYNNTKRNNYNSLSCEKSTQNQVNQDKLEQINVFGYEENNVFLVNNKSNKTNKTIKTNKTSITNKTGRSRSMNLSISEKLVIKSKVNNRENKTQSLNKIDIVKYKNINSTRLNRHMTKAQNNNSGKNHHNLEIIFSKSALLLDSVNNDNLLNYIGNKTNIEEKHKYVSSINTFKTLDTWKLASKENKIELNNKIKDNEACDYSQSKNISNNLSGNDNNKIDTLHINNKRHDMIKFDKAKINKLLVNNNKSDISKENTIITNTLIEYDDDNSNNNKLRTSIDKANSIISFNTKYKKENNSQEPVYYTTDPKIYLNRILDSVNQVHYNKLFENIYPHQRTTKSFKFYKDLGRNLLNSNLSNNRNDQILITENDNDNYNNYNNIGDNHISKNNDLVLRYKQIKNTKLYEKRNPQVKQKKLFQLFSKDSKELAEKYINSLEQKILNQEIFNRKQLIIGKNKNHINNPNNTNGYGIYSNSKAVNTSQNILNIISSNNNSNSNNKSNNKNSTDSSTNYHSGNINTNSNINIDNFSKKNSTNKSKNHLFKKFTEKEILSIIRKEEYEEDFNAYSKSCLFTNLKNGFKDNGLLMPKMNLNTCFHQAYNTNYFNHCINNNLNFKRTKIDNKTNQEDMLLQGKLNKEFTTLFPQVRVDLINKIY